MIQLSREMLNRYFDAKREWEFVQRMVGEEILTQSGFKKGDVVKTPEGVRYRIDGGSGYLLDDGKPTLSLHATRVYTTGRRPARSSTYLSHTAVTKVDQ